MNLDIDVNDYLLAWYLLYGASLSKEIDRFKRTLYTKYKKEYNFCYKDRSEIIKYGKDFIPDNDILYNAVLSSNLFKYLKKETVKHKNYIMKLWDSNKDELNNYIHDVLRINYPKVINVFIIHPRLEITEYITESNGLIWGSDKDKYDVLTIILSIATKGLLKQEVEKYDTNKEIVDSIIELSILNEIGKKINKNQTYELGNPVLKLIKRQIYPFWLMYLGYSDKEKMLNKMIEDRIGFDLDKYPLDKGLKKMNLKLFTDYCIKNSRNILKLNNIMQIEKEDEIEIL